MAISIQTNVSALNAQENLRTTNDFQARTISRLTSGYRINQSGDDAAGLAVANKFRSDVAELTQGVRNANDGLSTLQIVDGGLSNVSKILDRLKTLATQSASTTFEGSRTTLNSEYQDLLTEVNRQAGLVGLGNGSVGGRYNTSIQVYTGGAQQGTPKVTVDLSGAANRVDASGLKLTATSIDNGAVSTITSNVRNIATATDLLTGGGTQAFAFNIAKAGVPAFSTTVTVTGDADGLTASEAVGQLNTVLNQYGISASVDVADGKLKFGGDTAFTATTTSAAAVGVTLATTTGTVSNLSQYSFNGQATYAAPTVTDEAITISVGSVSATSTLTVAGAADINAALVQLNNSFNAIGVFAVKNAAGTGIDFQGGADFSVATVQAGGAGGVVSGATSSATSATDPTATGSTTSAAEAAITAISAAVSALGVVQGKVGSGQNKISYAIQLSQSQITNFSAAESRIRDADVAAEAANLTKAQVLSQASLAALAQANSAPQAVLSLLRG
ncbi:MAG: hypothetical protein H7Y20_08675 [Bryobacteraceae bacterium]|nr:hypothetical protein [Bryobacteraceae bacterium]